MLNIIKIQCLVLSMLLSIPLFAQSPYPFLKELEFTSSKEKVLIFSKQTPDLSELEFRTAKKTSRFVPSPMNYTSLSDAKVLTQKNKKFLVTKWRSGMRSQEVIVFDPLSSNPEVYRESSEGEIYFEVVKSRLDITIINSQGNQETKSWSPKSE